MRNLLSQPRFTVWLARYWRVFLTAIALIWMSGCATHGSTVASSYAPESVEQLWIQSVIDFKDQLPVGHPDQISEVFQINEEMRQAVVDQFGGLSKLGAAEGIARWLLDEHGRNMKYDVAANYSPIQAFEQRRGNCLSFTMLLNSLAKELDIKIEYNSVDIPDTWGMDETLGMVFYRHVNGMLRASGKRQIFDLAMDIYDSGYPQKFVSKTQIMAMFMNNRAVNHLEVEDFDGALYDIKLGVSYDPSNPDLWVNLGVVRKRQGNLKQAEIAFLHAYSINRYSVVAVSNLERLYREQGQTSQAQKFAKQAERARLSNPYVHYQRALDLYEQEKYKKASRATKRAIILHSKDPRFFELQSLIAQQKGQYVKAVKALEKAYLASSSLNQRGKYADKVELVTQNAISEYERNSKKTRGARVYKDVEIRPVNGF